MIRPLQKTDKGPIRDIAISTGNFNDDEVACCLAMVDDALDPHYLPANFACYDEDGAVIGFIGYGLDEMTDGTWEIYWVAVRKTSQRKGVGKELMLHAEKEAKKAMARQLVLETSSKQNYAHVRRFYKQLGYRKIAVIPDYFAPGDDKEVYVKRVS